MSMLLNNAQVDIDQNEIIESANNYTALNMAYLIDEQKEFHKNQAQRMITESTWMKACMESGFILPIQEADETKAEPVNNSSSTTTTKKKSSIVSKVTSTVKQWVNNFLTRLAADTAQRYSEYGPWAEYYKNDLIAAVSKKDHGLSYKVVPYHEVDYKTQNTICVSAMNKAFRNIQSENYTDYSYTDSIVDNKYVAGEDADAGAMNTYILNYFRTGKKNVSDIAKVTLSGQDLTKFVETAIAYISRYKAEVQSNVKKVSTSYQKLDTIQSIKVESIDPYMYLAVEDKMLCESDLVSLINYNTLLEADTPKPADDKEKTTATVDGESGSATKVEKVDDKGQPIDKKDETKTNEEKKETSGDKDKYIATYKKFATSIITDYARVCDERMICYANVLMQVAQASKIPTPKKDDKGNVTFKKREENTETKK